MHIMQMTIMKDGESGRQMTGIEVEVLSHQGEIR